jgi:hypothetical protein
VPLFIAGLFQDRGIAQRAITALLDAGVASSEISLVAREESEEDMPDRDEISADESQFQDLAIHSAWERLGWQGGARPAYRDKVTPKIDMAFVAAGPLAIAIGGAQLGACSGGIIGSMSNFGFPHDLAHQWYDRIVEGGAWVMVRSRESQAAQSREVFERYNPDLRAESLRHW